MIVDGSTLKPESYREHDVCIVGSGIAGVLLAIELERSGQNVCLVESGSWTPDAETQALYDLKNTGLPTRKNFQSRLRHYGGSCNIWAGRAMVYQPIDMQQRSWSSLAGWPIPLEELNPYYERATQHMRLPSYDFFDFNNWSNKISEFEASLVENGSFKPVVVTFAKSPARFGYKTEFHKIISDSTGVTAYTQSNVINLDLTDDLSTVESVDVACLNGVHFSIRAERFILACGGLENTRILLASNQQIPAGIGNEHGMVGKYYMDHPRAVFGRVNLTKRIGLDHTLGLPVKGGKLQLAYGLSDKLQQAEGLLNSYLSLEPNYSSFITDFYHKFVKLMKRLLRKGYSGDRFDFKKEEVADVPEMIYLLTPKELLPHSLYYAYYKFTRFVRKFVSRLTHLTIVSYSDQDLVEESQVTLGTERDKLGMPKMELHWQSSPRSIQTSLRLIRLLDEHLRKHDVGFVEGNVDEWEELPYTDASHHIGTTRMSRTPEQGVVDVNCKIHSVSNLYMAGSSVFPTAGHANPTFTIAALAIRLADHLKQQAS